MEIENWMFADSPNTAVFADKRIMREGDWVAYVLHDDDGTWQFHTAGIEPLVEEDALVVSLRSVIMLDKTLVDLANLPLGWRAWRSSISNEWQRGPVSD